MKIFPDLWLELNAAGYFADDIREASTKIVNQKLLSALTELNNEDISGNLIIIDMNKIRIKRPGQ